MVRLEADPSLYATPWFLTIFAAHFPLGFVSRVLDLVFLEGTAAALVKVIISKKSIQEKAISYSY